MIAIHRHTVFDGFSRQAILVVWIVALLASHSVPARAFDVATLRYPLRQPVVDTTWTGNGIHPSFLQSTAVTKRRSRSRLASHGDRHYNDDIARLQGEFRMLQDALLDRLAKPEQVTDDEEEEEPLGDNAYYTSAEAVAERMLDVAADAVALQRYKQVQAVERAEMQLHDASEDRRTAAALKGASHLAAHSAEREADLVESVDAPYEDHERVRELAKAHAAHHREVDAREVELEGIFQELEAEAQQNEARRAIAELREYELRLRESVQQIRRQQCEKALEEWKEHEQHKYDAILDQIKWKFDL